MDIDDDEELARLYDQDEQARDIAEEAFVSLLEHVDLNDPAWRQRRVLDVGCGTGLFTERVAPLVGQEVAVDVAPAMLSMLSEKRIGNVELCRGDIDDEPFSGSFDLIVASCVCGVLPDYPATVRRLAGALRPGGVFAQWDWLLDEDAAQEDGLTLEAVAGAFKGAGLTSVFADHAFDALYDGDALLQAVGLKMPVLN